jgi:hypothetical protein
VEGELGKLVTDASGSISKLAETLRSGADKLRADLDVPREERASGPLARGLPTGSDAHANEDRPAVASPQPAPAAAKPEAPVPASSATADPPRMEQGAAETAPQPETQRRPFGSPAPPAAGNGASGVQPGVGPRIEAINLAKSGASRDEVARHLEEMRWRRWPTACLAYIACSVGCLAASLALGGIESRWDHWQVIAICTVMGGGLSGWMLMTVVETRREDRAARPFGRMDEPPA